MPRPAVGGDGAGREERARDIQQVIVLAGELEQRYPAEGGQSATEDGFGDFLTPVGPFGGHLSCMDISYSLCT